MRRAVFLDRDGVLNRAFLRDGRPVPPATLDQFEILAEVPGALARLHDAGYLLVVATNQPDVATGLQSRETVDAMHGRLMAELPIDRIEACFATEAQAPAHYKPAPGMLLDAASVLDIDLEHSYMVGDRWRDVDCGHAAGCFSIFIDRAYGEPLRSAPDAICSDLADAADFIISHERVERVAYVRHR